MKISIPNRNHSARGRLALLVVAGLLFALPAGFAAKAPKQITGGKIGVGTWRTQAEFKDIHVIHEGQAYPVSIPKDLTSWKTWRGKWEVADGVLRQTSFDEDARAVLAGNLPWTDYAIALKARKTAGVEGFLILFGMQDADSPVRSWWNIGGWNNSAHAFQSPGVLEIQMEGEVEQDRWYDIRVEVEGLTIRGFLDGKLVQTGKRID